MFAENNISVLIAKACVNLNHSSTACENLKNIKATLCSLDSMQKALLLVQDVKTRWYLMLKRLEKLKLSVQSYKVNNKNFKPENILTADEWKLVGLLIELLKPFYIVTQQCSNNNALLSSVIRRAAALKRFFNHKTNRNLSESSFTTLESLAESIEEAFERRLYSTNNS